MLLAYEKGASLIVSVGAHFNLVEFLGKAQGRDVLDLPHPPADRRDAGGREGRQPPLPAASAQEGQLPRPAGALPARRSSSLGRLGAARGAPGPAAGSSSWSASAARADRRSGRRRAPRPAGSWLALAAGSPRPGRSRRSARWRSRLGRRREAGAGYLIDVLVLALAAHLGNLLDMRPGRPGEGRGLVGAAGLRSDRWSARAARAVAPLVPAAGDLRLADAAGAGDARR